MGRMDGIKPEGVTCHTVTTSSESLTDRIASQGTVAVVTVEATIVGIISCTEQGVVVTACTGG